MHVEEFNLRHAFIVTYNTGQLCPNFAWAHRGLTTVPLQNYLRIKKLILKLLRTGLSYNVHANDTTV